MAYPVLASPRHDHVGKLNETMSERNAVPRTRSRLFRLYAAMAVLGLLTSCGHPKSIRVQGYVEGEYVYVSSPLAGPLLTLQVQRGDTVKAGEPLYVLDRTVQRAALDQAQASCGRRNSA